MFLAYPLQHPVIISSFFYVMQINPCLSHQELEHHVMELCWEEGMGREEEDR